MPPFRVVEIRDVDALRAAARPWNDLWQRSRVTSPICRAEPVSLRVEHLDGESSFRALVVELDGRFVAALPLIGRRLKGVIGVGTLPSNCWLAGGALLLDPDCDVPNALGSLCNAVRDLPWPLLWFDQVPFQNEIWSAFRDAAQRAGLSTTEREHYQIGQIEFTGSWESYKSRMKGDHRRKLNRYIRKLDEAGGAELKLFQPSSPDEAEELTRRAFEIEDRSWKGTEQTSVLKNAAVFEHFCREARILAKSGHLEIAFLEHRGRSIAFIFAYCAKGVFYSTKLGYDDEFAQFGPGQQLLWRLLESLHSDPTRRIFDFAGPFVPFHQVWTTRSYPVGPVVLATPSVLGQSLFHAYTKWQPRAKRAAQKLSASLAAARTTALAAVHRIRSALRPDHAGQSPHVEAPGERVA